MSRQMRLARMRCEWAVAAGVLLACLWVASSVVQVDTSYLLLGGESIAHFLVGTICGELCKVGLIAARVHTLPESWLGLLLPFTRHSETCGGSLCFAGMLA